MEQDDDHQQQVGEGRHVQLGAFELLQGIALDDLNVQEKYDFMDMIEHNGHGAQVGANHDDHDDGSSWGSDWLGNSGSEMEAEDPRRLYRLCLKVYRAVFTPMYSFQPQRLIRVAHKTSHHEGEYPIARSGHRIIATESHLNSLDGYNPNMDLQELWSFNLATSRWKLLLDANDSGMPQELLSNALAIYNNVLISHGGTGYPFGEKCSNHSYVYTTGEQPQAMLLNVTGDLPTVQHGAAIVIHNDYLYTIGGAEGRHDCSCDVYRLNLLTNLWENVYICRPEIRDDPEGRYGHEVAYDGHHIYVVGGCNSNTIYGLQRIPAFNIETSRWDHFDTLPDPTAASADGLEYPQARTYLSCAYHTCNNGDVEAFITGGCQEDLGTILNDIWKLNLHTKQWHKIHTATLPRPMSFHSAAHADNSCMY